MIVHGFGTDTAVAAECPSLSRSAKPPERCRIRSNAKLGRRVGANFAYLDMGRRGLQCCKRGSQGPALIAEKAGVLTVSGRGFAEYRLFVLSRRIAPVHDEIGIKFVLHTLSFYELRLGFDRC